MVPLFVSKTRMHVVCIVEMGRARLHLKHYLEVLLMA